MLDMNPLYIVIMGLVMVISLPLHELAHARIALAFGDPTAKAMGRISLNPLRHLDIVGAISFFLIGFGWAKPVPVNPDNLHPRRLGDMMVSLAGPLSNLGLAAVAGLVLRAWPLYAGALNGIALGEMHASVFVLMFLQTLLQANLFLCIFNLIPLYPLDGHHIARELLPGPWRYDFMRWQLKFGQITMLAIVFLPGLLRNFGGLQVMSPLVWVYRYVGEPIATFLAGPYA